MPTIENGYPSNTLAGLKAAVGITSTSSSGASTVVSTSIAHGMATGDWADFYGIQGAVQANGVYAVTVSGTTSLTLPVTTSTAGSGGHVQSLAIGSTFNEPADGDQINAASVGVPFNALADRTSFAGVVTGAYKIAYYREIADTDTLSGTWPDTWDSFSYSADATWTPLVSGVPVWQVNVGYSVNQGDIVRLEFDASAVAILSASVDVQLGLALFVSVAQPGAAYSSLFEVPGSARILSSSGPASGTLTISMAAHCSGSLTAGSGSWPTGNGYLFKVYLQSAVQGHASISNAAFMQGDYNMRVTILRPTSYPQ